MKIDFADKYSKLLQNYSKELDTVRKIYEKNKEDPPLSRNLPPTAGRIIWARQLYQRISQPIKLLQEKMDLNKSDDGKQLIKNFNKIAEALLQYEVLFYRNWERSIDLIKKGMQATVYIRQPETKVRKISPWAHQRISRRTTSFSLAGRIRQFRSSSARVDQRCSISLATRLRDSWNGHHLAPARRTNPTDQCRFTRIAQRYQTGLRHHSKRHVSSLQTTPRKGRRSPPAGFCFHYVVFIEHRRLYVLH